MNVTSHLKLQKSLTFFSCSRCFTSNLGLSRLLAACGRQTRQTRSKSSGLRKDADTACMSSFIPTCVETDFKLAKALFAQLHSPALSASSSADEKKRPTVSAAPSSFHVNETSYVQRSRSRDVDA